MNKNLTALILHIALSSIAATMAITILATPTVAEAGQIAEYADELYKLITTGKPGMAAMLVARAYADGEDYEELLNRVIKKLVDNHEGLSADVRNKAYKYLQDSTRLIEVYTKNNPFIFPVAPFTMTGLDEEVRKIIEEEKYGGVAPKRTPEET